MTILFWIEWKWFKVLRFVDVQMTSFPPFFVAVVVSKQRCRCWCRLVMLVHNVAVVLEEKSTWTVLFLCCYSWCYCWTMSFFRSCDWCCCSTKSFVIGVAAERRRFLVHVIDVEGHRCQSRCCCWSYYLNDVVFNFMNFVLTKWWCCFDKKTTFLLLIRSICNC